MEKREPILAAIVNELQEKHDCHTIILYGSRARGDASDASDYDVLGIRDGGESVRDARLWNGIYLDAFIYPQSQLEHPHNGMLDMRQGRVLLEKDNVAQTFFARLERIYLRGPEKLAPDQISAHRAWYEKALDRIRLGGTQGHVRRFELVPTLLEDYFTVRNEWYRGPKASFQWLKEYEPELHAAFEAAFEPTAEIATLEKLVRLVDAKFEKEAKPRASSPNEQPRRPDFIKNWREIQDADNAAYPDSDEKLSIGSALGKKTGLVKIGIHHELIPPGRRTSWPHAESCEEEFAFVLEGQPDVWIDGDLHRLSEGDVVAFPAGTGIAHTFINNTNQDVRLIVGGERTKPENKIVYPKHPELAQKRKDWWSDAPVRQLGPHDGLPDQLRAQRSRFETQRLILEPITLAHAEELRDFFADTRLHEFVPFQPPTLEQQKRRCLIWEGGRAPDGSEIYVNWAARDRVSGKIAGHFQAGVKPDHTAAIGYVVAREFQGQGLALEAMLAVFDLLRDRYQVLEVKAWTDTRNFASHRLAEKLGMTLVETLKNADFFKGQASDEFVYAKRLR